MKASAVSWLGPLPDHWRLERAKWLFRKMDRAVSDTDDVITCFRDGVVTLRRNRRTRGFTESLQEIGYQGIKRGDLVIHAMDAFAGAVGVADADGKGTGVYSVCEPKPNADPNYYKYVVREMARSGWILALAKGIRERSTDFRFATFATQLVPLPPIEEQRSIARFLDDADRRIQRTIRAKQRLIALLSEHKQGVIHSVVTHGLDTSVRLKPSGVDWIGHVPERWEVRRLKTLCNMKSGDGITGDSIEPVGTYPVYGGNGIRGYAESWTHSGEYVLIGRQGALCGNVHLVSGESWVSEHAVVASPHRMHDIRWFAALLTSMNLNQYSVAAAQPGLAVERIMNLRVPVPPADEQRRIAERITGDTADLDRATRAVEREAALLREYRTQLIADVVTGKLDVRDAAARLPDEADGPEPFDGINIEESGDAEIDALEAGEV